MTRAGAAFLVPNTISKPRKLQLRGRTSLAFIYSRYDVTESPPPTRGTPPVQPRFRSKPELRHGIPSRRSGKPLPYRKTRYNSICLTVTLIIHRLTYIQDVFIQSFIGNTNSYVLLNRVTNRTRYLRIFMIVLSLSQRLRLQKSLKIQTGSFGPSFCRLLPEKGMLSLFLITTTMKCWYKII